MNEKCERKEEEEEETKIEEGNTEGKKMKMNTIKYKSTNKSISTSTFKKTFTTVKVTQEDSCF